LHRVKVHIAFAALLAAAALCLCAQEEPPPSAGARGGRAGRGGRGGAAATREFLGLGPAPDPVAAERGSKLYAPNCAFCHGKKANGAEAPDLVRSPLVLHDEKGELIGPLLLKGRPDKGMPAFASLTPAQVSDIVQFLHLRVELTANPGTYQTLNVITADARQDRITGTLKRLDDFTVSLYDSAGNYLSYSRAAGPKVEVEDRLVAHRRLLDVYSDADVHNLTAYLVTLK
jgi:mono/diheme cytochrome c family protein